MNLYFAGAANPIYLRKLVKLGVTHVAIDYLEWQRRFASDDLFKRIPEGLEVCITSGVARKGEDFDFTSFSKDYLEFCEKNAEQALIYDMDAANCPAGIRESTRNMLSMLPNVVMFPFGDEDLVQLAKKYERIGINASLAKSIPSVELRRIHASLYGSNVTDAKVLRPARFVATTTLTWLAGRRYGELWVFARNKMHHYKAEAVAKAVRAHARDLEALGIDVAKCTSSNDKVRADALTAAAVRSFQALINSFSVRPRDRHTVEIAAGSANSGTDDVLSTVTQTPAELVVGNGVVPLFQRERVTLPGLLIKDLDGKRFVNRNDASLRQCDSCSLSDHCPQYEKEMTCAFSIPVEIKTVEQWEAASATLLEFQFERVAFARMAEQVDGEILNPRVGQEIDRFTKLLKDVKELKTPIPNPAGGALARAFQTAALNAGESNATEENDEEDDDYDGQIQDSDEVFEEFETVGD